MRGNWFGFIGFALWNGFRVKLMKVTYNSLLRLWCGNNLVQRWIWVRFWLIRNRWRNSKFDRSYLWSISRLRTTLNSRPLSQLTHQNNRLLNHKTSLLIRPWNHEIPSFHSKEKVLRWKWTRPKCNDRSKRTDLKKINACDARNVRSSWEIL